MSRFAPKMGDFDSGIGIDSGITLIFSHFGIGIGIKSLGNAGIGIKFARNRNQPINGIDCNFYWNRNWNRNRNHSYVESESESESSLFKRLESESESESNILLESESEPESRLSRNRPSLIRTSLIQRQGCKDSGVNFQNRQMAN